MDSALTNPLPLLHTIKESSVQWIVFTLSHVMIDNNLKHFSVVDVSILVSNPISSLLRKFLIFDDRFASPE